MKQHFHFKFHDRDDTDLEQLLLIYKQISVDSPVSVLQRFHMQTIYILPKSKQTNKNKNKKALHTANLEKKYLNSFSYLLTLL